MAPEQTGKRVEHDLGLLVNVIMVAFLAVAAWGLARQLLGVWHGNRTVTESLLRDFAPWVPGVVGRLTSLLLVALGGGFVCLFLTGFMLKYPRTVSADVDGLSIITFWGARLYIPWSDVRSIAVIGPHGFLRPLWGPYTGFSLTSGRQWRVWGSSFPFDLEDVLKETGRLELLAWPDGERPEPEEDEE